MTSWGPYRGTVANVHDGDTVDIRLDVGFDLTVYARVRVAGINAAELSTPEGKTARDFAQSLLPAGSRVEVVSHGWDKYGGRIDGDIRCADDRDFATVMLAVGEAVRWDGEGPKRVPGGGA